MTAALPRQSRSLTPLEWMMPQSYIKQVLYFPSFDPRAWEVLQHAIAGVVKDVPYLACGVMGQKHPRGAVKLSEPYQSPQQLLSYRDLSKTVDYNVLRSKGFSPWALDDLCIIPNDLETSNNSPSPVFRAVLARVHHGFLLCVFVHHSTTDITGFGSLMKVWASHCKTGSGKEIGFADAWSCPRELLGNPAQAPQCFPELLHIQDHDTSKKVNAEVAGLETAIFAFSKDFLQALKHEVNSHCITAGSGSTLVSTGDILAALLWSAVVFAENEAECNTGTRYQAERVHQMRIPVNVRNRCNPPLSANYLGSAFVVSSATMRESDLYQVVSGDDRTALILALAGIASTLRRAINLVDAKNVRDAVSFLAAQSDITNIKLGPCNADLSIVSWAHENITDLNWGSHVGYCEAVRPSSFRTKRYPIILPRLQSGDMEVITCLEMKTMACLKGIWFMKQL